MTDKPIRKTIRCKECGKYLFSITITIESPRVGSVGAIEGLRCPNRRCGCVHDVLIGVADKDQSNDVEKVEQELKNKL